MNRGIVRKTDTGYSVEIKSCWGTGEFISNADSIPDARAILRKHDIYKQQTIVVED